MIWFFLVLASLFWHPLVFGQGLPFPGPGVKGYAATGITHVTDVVSSFGNGVDSLTANITPGSGDLLVVSIVVFSADPPSATVSDNVNSGNYTQAFATKLTSDGSQGVLQYYKNNVAGSATTVTVNPNTASAFFFFIITEFSGQDTSAGVLDTASTTAGGTSTAPSVTTATLAQANNAVVAMVTHNVTTSTITPGSGYTQISESEDNTTTIAYNLEYKIVNATTAVTANWTLGTSGNWCVGVGIYK